MNTVLRRICILAVIIAAAMSMYSAVFADDYNEEIRQIKIGGVEVLAPDGSVKPGVLPEGMMFDGNNALLLENCTYTCPEGVGTCIEFIGFTEAGVYARGVNVLKGSSGVESGYLYGIKADCPLSVYGEGYLLIDHTASDGSAIGIEGSAEIEIKNMILDINGGNGYRHGDFYGIRMRDDQMYYFENSLEDPYKYCVAINNADVTIENKGAFADKEGNIRYYRNRGIDTIDTDLWIEKAVVKIRMTGATGIGIAAGYYLGSSYDGYGYYGGQLHIGETSRVNIQIPGSNSVYGMAMYCKSVEKDYYDAIGDDEDDYASCPSEAYKNMDIKPQFVYYADKDPQDYSNNTLYWNQYIVDQTLDEYGGLMYLYEKNVSQGWRYECKHFGLDISPTEQTDHEIPDINSIPDNGGSDNSESNQDGSSQQGGSNEERPIADGVKVQLPEGTFRIRSAAKKTVTYCTTAARGDAVVVPAYVTINGQRFEVVEIAARSFKGGKIRKAVISKNVEKIDKNAFTGSKVKTVVLKTKELVKKSVKGCFKKSNVKTVQVKVGKKKENRKFVAKYKKIFTKKNSGKKVTVK